MIELLVGVSIIALIVTIVSCSVISIINNSNEKQYMLNISKDGKIKVVDKVLILKGFGDYNFK